MKIKQFTILHSNDLHGDFQSEFQPDEGYHEGGLSLLSGYIKRARHETKNVLYFISGDIMQGSLLCSEFQAISTIELINYLKPDAVTLGNHEFDYGLSHLLLLEKLAIFPIISANLYIKKHNRLLMNSHIILDKDGFKIMVIGILTKEALDSIGKETAISHLISIENACDEIGRICNAYKTKNIDLTIILTHIGIKEDRILAAQLDPEWGVDLIIGGHSHTILNEPERINNIIIAHAGEGTDQIGRFEIHVDDLTNSIVNYTWELVPITCNTANQDLELLSFIENLQNEIDGKYNKLVCKLHAPITHPKREMETALGNLLADIFRDRAQSDLAFVGSGSIRSSRLGPTVTLGDIKTIYPFDDKLVKFIITGTQLIAMFNYYLHPDNRSNNEFYQINREVQVEYDLTQKRLRQLFIKDEPVRNEANYTVCFEEFHYNNLEKKLNISSTEISQLKPQTVSHSCLDILIEFFSTHQNISSRVEGRIIDKT